MNIDVPNSAGATILQVGQRDVSHEASELWPDVRIHVAGLQTNLYAVQPVANSVGIADVLVAEAAEHILDRGFVGSEM